MKHLASFQKDNPPFNQSSKMIRARFVILSKLEETFICKLTSFILYISYAQIFCQTTQIVRKYFPKDLGREESFAFETLEDIFTFENIFNYNGDNKVLLLTFISITLYFLLFILLFLVTIYQALESKQYSSMENKIWAIFLHIHAPILFFPINNLCNRIQITFWNDTLKLSYEGYNGILFYCSITVCLVNFVFALTPYIFVFDILPNRNSLSSKNFLNDQMILYQKLLVSLFEKIFPNTPTFGWLMISLVSSFCLARQFWYMHFLPRYHFQTLAIDLHLNSICSVTSVIALTTFSVKHVTGSNISISSFWTVLILFVPLTVIYVRVAFNQIIKEIIFEPYQDLNPYKALHKVLMLKFLHKAMKTPLWRTKRFETYYFYFSTLQSIWKNIFGPKNEESSNNAKEIDLNIREHQDKIKRYYLEALMSYYSKVEEIKLLLAKYYTKNPNFCILAIKTLMKIKSNSLKIRTSMEVLRFNIQQQVIEISKTNHLRLNLHDYFMTEKKKMLLKEKIKIEFNYQESFWKELRKDNPEFRELQKLSELIFCQKEKVSKYWTELNRQSNEAINYFYSLYGFYQALLNDLPFKGREYLKKYNLFHARQSQQKVLTSLNLCDRDNFSITISTHYENLGNITYCSNNIKKALGYKKRDIIGSNVGIIMTPFIGAKHNTFIQDYIKTGQSAIMFQLQYVFVKNRSGSIQKFSLWADIHPFIHDDISLTGLFRPVPDLNEYIFLTPQGEIDSCTASIGLKLNISGKKVNITSICHEFTNLCEIFNLNVNQDYKSSAITSEDALYPIRTQISSPKEPLLSFPIDSPSFQQCELKLKEQEINCELEFNPYCEPSQSHFYKCKIRMLRVKETYMVSMELDFANEKTKFQKLDRPISNQNDKKEKFKNPQTNRSFEEDYNTGIAELSPKMIYFTERKTSNQNENKMNASSHLKERFQLQHIKQNKNSQAINKVLKRESFLKKQSQSNKRKSLDFINIPHQVAKKSLDESSTSLDQRRQTYIKEIFQVQYYPKSVKAYLVLLVIIFIGTLVLELYLKMRVENDLYNSKALTATLEIASLRADAFTQTARAARAAFIDQAKFVPEDSEAHDIIIKNIVVNLRTNIKTLKETNAKLQLTIQDIDQVFQEKFKSSNIRIYEVNPDLTIESDKKFNAFNSINMLLDKLLKVYNYYLKIGQFNLQDLFYILVNSVNDSLEGTINTIKLILESTHLSFQNTSSVLRICLILRILLFISGSLITILLFFHIYGLELKFMQQYVGLSAQDIQIVLERLEFFNRIFQSEDFVEVRSLNLFLSSVHDKEQNNAAKQQRAQAKSNLKEKSLQMFYWKHIIAFVLIFVVYILGTFHRFLETNSKIAILESKINGLTKAQSLLYETSILAFTLGQIVCGDNVSLIRNRPPEHELESDLNNLIRSSNELLDVFTREDGTYDPVIIPFFFENVCTFMPPLSWTSLQCMNIVKDSKDFGLLRLFFRHYALYSQIYEDFKASNKSFGDLSEIVAYLIVNGTPSTLIIRQLMQILIEKTESDLAMLWDTTKLNVNIFFTLFPLFLVIIVLITWRFILKHFVECCNRFKKMMEIIPFKILVKNPTLKGTLMILSKGKLSKLGNELL